MLNPASVTHLLQPKSALLLRFGKLALHDIGGDGLSSVKRSRVSVHDLCGSEVDGELPSQQQMSLSETFTIDDRVPTTPCTAAKQVQMATGALTS